MKWIGSRRRRFSRIGLLLLGGICTVFSLMMLMLITRSIDPLSGFEFPETSSLDEPFELTEPQNLNESFLSDLTTESVVKKGRGSDSCATVEQMGKAFADDVGEESLRVRRIIQHHFSLHGASRVRELPPEQFCRQGFVLGKASEAGFGNEMYKILTAGALSILLNRSLIIGQTRGKFPFGEYIAYTNHSFTLKEVKHLWRKNDCVGKYGRHLIMRTDDFERPAETNVLCSNWRKWKQPIIWFQGTTDAVAAQFFLKNIHSEMRNAASNLFGLPKILNKPNVFGELMRVIISPSKDVEESVNWALRGGPYPDIALHMRMLMNRPIRAMQAALNCTKRIFQSYQHHEAKPRVVLVSDTPAFIKDMSPYFQEIAEVIHFDYKLFKGNTSGLASHGENQLSFRVKDWGPAPRWVAFVDFFLASRAKHAVVSGAHRRVGTTYAQLIAALAAANQLDEDFPTSRFSFFSSFHSNLLSEGLGNQVGWGHAWNRFAGSFSCRNQPNQCAHTPLLPPGWWDGSLQSPIPRDIRRMEAFGVLLSATGEINESHLLSFCSKRKTVVKTLPVFHQT